MLPEEYQIDELTDRRMEQETGAPLPEGALEALYRFDQEYPDFADAIRRRSGGGPELTWLCAMTLARLGPLKYMEYWRDEIAREARRLEEMLSIPPVTEYKIDGFHIKYMGPEPVEHEGEVSIKHCWQITDDGAGEPLWSVYLDDDAPVEKIIRKFTGWTRQLQGEDEGPWLDGE